MEKEPEETQTGAAAPSQQAEIDDEASNRQWRQARYFREQVPALLLVVMLGAWIVMVWL
jgi:hypothetical protein